MRGGSGLAKAEDDTSSVKAVGHDHGECALAGASQGVRPLEQCVEAVREVGVRCNRVYRILYAPIEHRRPIEQKRPITASLMREPFA
jgi:hypothetical protein